jgi:glutamate formiminotransferase / formiminotetrahydrofolate cyclodeaminase
VANLSSHKAGWDDRWEEFSDWAEKGQQIKDELLFLVDEDTRAFNRIMDAFGLPKKTHDEIAARKHAIEEASKYAIQIPFRVMEKSYSAFEILKAMAEHGLKASVSDVGVGALCIRTAVMGAFLNVKINASGLEDKAYAAEIVKKGQGIVEDTIKKEAEILAIVNSKIKLD